MKKCIVILAAGFLLSVGCNKSATTKDEAINEDEARATKRDCATYAVFEQQLRENPDQDASYIRGWRSACKL